MWPFKENEIRKQKTFSLLLIVTGLLLFVNQTLLFSVYGLTVNASAIGVLLTILGFLYFADVAL